MLTSILSAARTSLGRHRRGDTVPRLTAVLRSVTADLVERRALPEDVGSRFVADPTRLREAVDQLLTLVAA